MPAAHARCVDVGAQRFLEIDRIGARGRRGVLSLSAVDDEYVGEGTSWTALARRLERQGLCSTSDARRLVGLDVFGQLTANSDRHLGNVSFFTGEGDALSLCPAYDAAPMLFAPAQTTVVERDFVPRGPTAETLSVWRDAADAAADFWSRAAAHGGLSAAMQARVADAQARLRALRAQAPV